MRPLAQLALCLALATASTARAGDGAHWAYDGHSGPEHWAELSSQFSMCGAGRNQSPIDIVTPVSASLSPIAFNYPLDATEILNNGHTVQINIAPGSRIAMDGQPYELKQVHFHTPSENRIDGKTYDAEAHFVHADQAGNLAVVAVMFEQGAKNVALTALDAELPDTAGDRHGLSTRSPLAELLPESRDYYAYSGSLTTPPCSEGVRWLVMKQPITISAAQRDTLARVMHAPNARPVQPLNARLVLQ